MKRKDMTDEQKAKDDKLFCVIVGFVFLFGIIVFILPLFTTL